MDKNKIIEAAAKLVAKGAYDKAIKEYQKILDVDPKDVRILQKMGELYQKKNDNVQAAQYFTKVAESYTTDGFFLKAVALYKQVLKLDPNLVEINIRLAELHQQLQLLGEAMAYFQIVANHYDKNGDTKRSLDVLRKMVDLDPDNVPSRIKLADLYVREKLNDEAVAEFKKAAEHLKRQNRTDDYLRVAERLSALEPENFPLARELAEIYLSKSDQKRALAKLQVCFKADPRDIETLKLLAVAFQGLGQTSKTVSVYKELAKAYEERGQNRDAEQTWSQVAQLDPNDPDVVARTAAHAPPPVTQPPPAPAATGAQPALPPAKSATVQAPAYQPPPAQAPAPAAAKPKGDPGIGKLLTETDVYVKYGLHDKALEHLRKIFSIDPENIDAHEKAYQIYQASNNQAQASEQLLNVLRLHTMSGDAQRAQPFLQTMLQTNPTHPEVPVFLQALRLGPGGAAAAAQQHAQKHAEPEVAEDAILVDSTEDDVIVADEPQDEVVSAEAVVEAAEEPAEVVAAASADDEGLVLAPDDAEAAGQYDLEPPPVADSELGGAQIVSDFEGDRPDLEQGELDTGEHEVQNDLAEEPLTDMAAVEAAGLDTPPPEEPPQTFAPDLGDPEQHESPTRVTKALDPALLRSAKDAEAPPSDDPFASSGEEPVEAPPEDDSLAAAGEISTGPGDTAAVDEQSFAGVAEDDERAIGDVPTGEVEAFAAAALRGSPTPVPAEEPAAGAPAEEEPAGEECDEATFFIEQGLFEEAQEILETIQIAYPDHQRAAQLMAQLEAARAGAEGAGAGAGEGEAAAPGDGAAAEGEGGKSAFDLAQELADELGGFGGGEEAAPQAQGDDYQVSVDEVFSEFKKGLEKVVKPEDVDTHYDLGIAYKEMGLIDDAIGEFTVARKGCLGKRKECDCLTMMGLLQLMKGDSATAVDSFKQGLQSEHAKDELEKALRFELASAYEANNEPGKALFQFQKVQALDPSFREVGGHVDRLAAIAAPEDDGSGSTPPPAPQPPSSPAAKKKPGGGGGGTGQQPALSRKVGYV